MYPRFKNLIPLLFCLSLFFVSVKLFLTILVFWLGLSLACVASAYYFNAAGLFRKKKDGSIPTPVRWLFFPYLLIIGVYNKYQRHHDSTPTIQKIVDNVYLGSRLIPQDVDNLSTVDIDGVLDLTAEFDGLGCFSDSESKIDYLNIPVLDHSTPHLAQLLQACRWIHEHRENNRSVLVHCALGRGRSVIVVAVYLVAIGHSASLDDALAFIQGIRTTAGLNKRQKRTVEEWLAHDFSQFSFRPKVKLIANPISGGGKWREIKDELYTTLDPYFDLSMVETQQDLSARELATQAMEDGYKHILACGGDGTVNEVADAVAGSDIHLGIIPGGTANALSQVLVGWGSKLNPVKSACDAIIRGRTRTIDTALCNGERMLLIAGIGIEERMVNHAERETKNRLGQFAYLEGFYLALEQHKPQKLYVSFDHSPAVEIDTTSFVIANAAPGFTVLAQGNGNPDCEDGYLDVTWFSASDNVKDNVSAIGTLTYNAVFSNSENKESNSESTKNNTSVNHRIARSLLISSEAELRYVLDGEPKSSKQLVIDVQAKSLTLYASLEEEDKDSEDSMAEEEVLPKTMSAGI